MILECLKNGAGSCRNESMIEKIIAERDAARVEAAEYRAMIDRCRERNKELGAECERLRDALGQIDVIVSALETDNSNQDAH